MRHIGTYTLYTYNYISNLYSIVYSRAPYNNIVIDVISFDEEN